jgi:pSer/pThr/pTyr-binding forkhead associated (FHA) protein
MAYPYCFVYKERIWNLVDLKRPEDKDTPYIILESLNSEKNSSRTIHTVVIKTEKRNFQIGRGHDSDLRINDISVSRKHASLEYRDDGFYIVDYQSKFGTLVLLSD